MPGTRFFSWFLLGCCLAAARHAGGEVLSLKQAQAAARKNHPGFAVLREQRRALAAALEGAGQAPGPEVSVTAGAGVAGAKEGQASLTLGLDRERTVKEVLDGERDLATLELESLTVRTELLARETASAVLDAYLDAASKARRCEALLLPLNSLRDLVAVLVVRRDKGDLPGLDLKLAQAELARDELTYTQATLEARSALLTLLSVMGKPETEHLPVLAAWKSPPSFTLNALTSHLKRRHPDLRQSALEVRRQEILLTMEKAKSRVRPALAMALELEKPREETTEAVISLGWKKPLGQARRQAPLIREKHLALSAAKREAKALAMLKTRELALAFELAQAAAKPVEALEKGLLPDFLTALEGHRKAYELGHTPLTDLLDLERRYIALIEDLEDARAQQAAAWAAVLKAAAMEDAIQ